MKKLAYFKIKSADENADQAINAILHALFKKEHPEMLIREQCGNIKIMNIAGESMKALSIQTRRLKKALKDKGIKAVVLDVVIK